MSGYYYECPHCLDVTPLNILDLGHHATRPDVDCYACGAAGCVTCMPDEVCDDCRDLDTETVCTECGRNLPEEFTDEEMDEMGFEEDIDDGETTLNDRND